MSLKCWLVFIMCQLNHPNIPFLVLRKHVMFDTEQLFVVYLKVIVLSYVAYLTKFQTSSEKCHLNIISCQNFPLCFCGANDNKISGLHFEMCAICHLSYLLPSVIYFSWLLKWVGSPEICSQSFRDYWTRVAIHRPDTLSHHCTFLC